MNKSSRHRRFAHLLIFVLVSAIVAACGAPAATVPTTVPTPLAEITSAPAEITSVAADITTAPEEITSAPEEITSVPAEITSAPEEITSVPEEITTAPDDTATGTSSVSPVGNILRLNFVVEPRTLDPQKTSFVNEAQFVLLNYLPLMTFDTELNPVPGAAESVDVSEDGQTFTFTLRPDQRYSDGTPLTAENFEYTWKRMCDPETAADYVSIAFPIVGCQEYFEAFDSGEITTTDTEALQVLRDAVGVEALDDSTLRVQLKEAAPYFLNVFALWLGSPARQDLIEAGGEDWWLDPANQIGNGPFQMVEYDPQGGGRFERNEHYVLTDHQPQIETVEVVLINDTNVAFEAFRAGDLDILDVSPDDLPAIQNDPVLRELYVEAQGSCTTYLGFNNTKAPFDNQDVRRAFAQALDRESWVRDILGGLGTEAYSFVPPGIPGHDPDGRTWAFDPEAARERLAASGYDMEQTIKLTYPEEPRLRRHHEYLASMLQNHLGVKIELDPIDPAAYAPLFESPETLPVMLLAGWCADYPDPQNWLSVVFRTGGVSAGPFGYSNPTFDDLTSRADTLLLDDPERMRLYQQAQEILIDDAPVAFFFYNKSGRLIQPWVKGVRFTALDFVPGFYALEEIEITTDE